ncbi:stage III sporulation protein AA [Pseudogracilibacillus auburnensis]|uniref:Stage III sporulation protein AA n=1 Tax=Pseudogracilibacillus auburnensis TaxID=1494959 RepID=A0A2V3VW42_9BACI|nr:stage III sporulation protein AA [Pseudogracilibacillus auburnensis]MBO1004289.1 stage III sporulation protein AA [Pseudogracilibacillus auburnensis]PXW85041.1 stage III sporulation protein AA [Pseudogracilibacillus auburnensis]
MNEILRLLPEHIKQAVRTQVMNKWDQLEEIRLRLNRPVELNYHHKMEWISDSQFTAKDSVYVLNQLSDHSLYRMEDELREGYITVSGGHRVGLAGEVITVNGKLKQLQHITFFNIRIAKEIKNVATPFINYLHDSHTYYNTLIIGAPQTGKTTFIRDIARLISDGEATVFSKKVGIIDERSEIAASMDGVPQHNVGGRTDVMDACPKVAGMMMMIRSMSPEVLIVDEIGKEEDVIALMEAVFAGVTVICTIHGNTMEELMKRPSVSILLKNQVFKRIIMLQKKNATYFNLEIRDECGRNITSSMVKKQ